jgi:hypothetical protein
MYSEHTAIAAASASK